MLSISLHSALPSTLEFLSDYIIIIMSEGMFILPSHYIWYTTTLLLLIVFECIGCIFLLRSKPTTSLASSGLIKITGKVAVLSLSIRERFALWNRVVSILPINYRRWNIIIRRVLFIASSFGCIATNKPISTLVDLMDIIWLEPRRGSTTTRLSCGIILPSHSMWYIRLLFILLGSIMGSINLGQPVSLLLDLIDVWLSRSRTLLSRCQMSIHWIQCNNLLHSFSGSIRGIAFDKPKEVFRTGLSIFLSLIDSFIIAVTENGTHVKVDPSCKFLSERAFRGNTLIVHIRLCEGLECLGSKAFRDCSSLKRINVPSTVKVVGEYAFRGCKQLRVIELRKGLERICDGSFVDCKSLERIYIPNTVRVIGDWTFCSCQRLTSIDLPEGLQHIGKWTFYDCTSLQRIKVPSSVKVIDEMAFINCVNLKQVELSKGLELIANHAFSSCASIKHIHIPSTVRLIGEVAFVNCTKLQHVELSEGLEDVGVEAFLGCISLHHINMPSTVKVIRERTFRGCVVLVDIELEEGLEQIMECAFESCMTLEQIKVPKSVKHIHPQSFLHCMSLKEVKFCDDIEHLVREASMQSWWNRGTSEIALTTYPLLVECGILERFSLLKSTKWRNRIYDMLERIPAIESQSLKQYVHFIDSKLSSYESAKDIASVLELAIWKANMMVEQCDPYTDNISCLDMKLGCRIKCGATVVIPNVLSFLLQD